MKTRNKVLIGLVLVAAALHGAAWYYYPWATWRYKMTVVVETPEAVKTGSAVREISVATPLIDLPDAHVPVDIKGEAVVVDLEERGLLFALITADSDSEFYAAFPVKGPTTPKGIRYYRSLEDGRKATLDPTKYPGYPQMVTFTDMNDPLSVQKVDKYDLSQTFGPGVALKEIILEVTDESVTWGIEEYLPANFFDYIHSEWKQLPFDTRVRISPLIKFRKGEKND